MNRIATQLRGAWLAMGASCAVALGAQACDGGAPKVVGDDGTQPTGGQTSATGGAASGGPNTGGSTGGATDGDAGSGATSSGGSTTGGAPPGGAAGGAGAPETTSCESNDDCEGGTPVCDTEAAVCVQCVEDSDCEDEEFCDGSMCKGDVCAAGETQCVGDGVAECNESGSGFGDPEACPEDQTCIETDGVAACGEAPPGQGGAGGVGGEAGAGNTPPGECTTATVDPCETIPKFEGTQTVDGNEDDLCDVPSFKLDFGGEVIDWRDDGPYTESAVVRVAWSSSGLHVFITVTDSSVNAWESGNLWDADGIELMFTTNTGGNGDVAADDEALHVAASYLSGASVVSGSPTTLPSGQHAGDTESDGYTIELLLPWQGEAPASGSEIRFDMTLNTANDQDGETWRDAQAILVRESVQGDSPCGDDKQPYCDTRTWCTTTLE